MMWLIYTAPLWTIGLLVFLPSVFEVHVKRREDVQGKAMFALGMGLVGTAVYIEREGLRISVVLFKRSLLRFKLKRKAKEKKPRRKKKAKLASEKSSEARGKKEKKGRPRGLWKKVQTAKMLFERYEEPAFRCLRSIFRAFRLRDFFLHLEIGLEDPAQTGFLAGWAHGLSHLTEQHIQLELTPNFVEPCFRGTARLRFHIALYRILWAVLRLIVEVVPGLIQLYLLPKLKWPKRTPLVMAHPEASG